MLPALAGVVAVPLLIDGMGLDRFALLTLVWVVAGHASAFDLGMGSALTHAVAERIGRGRPGEVPGVVGAALVLAGGAGALAGAALFVLAPTLAYGVLNVPAGLEAEATAGFRLLALGLPLITLTSSLRGALEAHQRFDLGSLIRVPLGVMVTVGPLLLLPFTDRFDALVGALVVVRGLGLAAYVVALWRATGALRGLRVERSAWRGLLRYGGWISVATGSGVTIEYASRFLIGSVLPVATIAYFATPADLIAKALLLPSAIVGVLFPTLSATLAADPRRGAVLIGRSSLAVLALMGPAMLGVVALAPEGLALWIDAGFAAQATRPLQWLAMAALVNGLATVTTASLVSVGRPDLTVKPLLIEVPLFLVALWLVLHGGYGVAGVAAVYAARVGVDLLIMSALCARHVPETGPALARVIAAATFVGGASWAVASAEPLVGRAAVGALALVGGGALGWATLVGASDRALLLERVAALRARLRVR